MKHMKRFPNAPMNRYLCA